MRKFLLISLAICFFQHSYGQDFSNKGKEFWVPYANHIDGTTSAMGIYITSDVAASGTITVGAVNVPFTVAANSVTRKFIGPGATGDAPNTTVYLTPMDGIQTGAAIHIVSDTPVAVYAHIIKSARSGATLALPTNVWGKEYIAPSYQNTGSSASYGEIEVMASQPNTTVEITPAKNSRTGTRVAGTPYQITLANPGDVYQLQFAASADLSGTRIKSVNCQPIGVYSATTWTGLGCANASGGDNLYQQLFPTSTWGKTFLTAPFKNRVSDIVRVMVSDPTTVVQKMELGVTTTLTGLVTPATGAGSFYQYSTGHPTVITADKAISVAHYITSQSCQTGPLFADPEMIILNPVEQTINNITVFSAHKNFVPAGQSVVDSCFLNIIIKTNAAASFRINGSVPSGTFVAIPGTIYSYLQESLTNAATIPVQTLLADSAFSAIAYGFGNVESYGYNAGTNVKDLYQQISVHTQYGIETTPSVCSGSPFQFKISLPYKPLQLNWDLTSILPTAPTAQQHPSQFPDPTCTQFTTPPYPVTDNTTYVCPDSIRSVNGVPIYWYSLPTFYNVGTIGTYPIHLTALTSNTDGCGTTQNIDFPLQVSDPPIADFTFIPPACSADTVHFTDMSETVKPEYHWYWDFGDGSPTSGVKNPTHVYPAAATGMTYQVSFSSITTPGCLSDTVRKNIFVPAQPKATISGTNAVCQGGANQTITFNGTDGTAPYIFYYHINTGAEQNTLSNGSGTSSGGSATITVVPNTVGTFIYTLDSVKNQLGSQLCVTPITGQLATITVNSIPTATISGAATVCQNSTPSPIVTFTGTNGRPPYTFTYHISTPAGGAGPDLMATSNAGVGPYIATVTAPTGTADVYTYVLTSVVDATTTLCNSTISNQSVAVTVHQLPTATISGTTELCLNAPPPTITFTGSGGTPPYKFGYTITNSGGTGPVIYTAFGVNTVTVPTTPADTYTYTLVSVQESSSTSCTNPQTGTATVIVDPKPTASFTYSTPDCESKDVTYTPTFAVSSGAVVSWIWDYGDGTGSHTRTDGNPFSINYATAGTKVVTFQTVSDKGCNSAVYTQNVVVSAKPVAGFISPQICLLDPFAQFTDTSHVAAGQPGSITAWAWDFGDIYATGPNPNTATTQNPTHIYTHVGPYTVQQIVTSSFGCKDTVSQVIIISDGNPHADYNVINPAGLCSNDSVGIINKSTIASGVITKLEIYWDYLNQPTVYDQEDNPNLNDIFKHKYPTLTTAANYKIHVRAYSGGVCYSAKDTTITVNAAPVAQLSPIPDVCLNNGTVQFTQGSETGGVPGTGVYSGTGVSPTGLFDPLIAGIGADVITYTFTSNFGCVDFKTTTVNVKAPPGGTMAVSAVTCQNSTVNFTYDPESGTFVPPAQYIFQWGDGTPNTTFPNPGPYSHIYTITGPIIATVVFVNSDGCRSTPQNISFTVNPQPHPKFGFTAVACLPQAKIDFTNSTFPGSISDWTYAWDFGDINANSSNPNTSTATAPSHIYTSVGPFNVHLTATSPITSCTNDTVIVVNTIHPAPTASFAINKLSICADQDIKLSDLSNPADGVMTVWSWDYGDNTGIAHGRVQPAHTYTDAGSYIIRLNVTNSFGCVDDTSSSFTVYPYPVIDAGPHQVVLQDGVSHLEGTASGNQLTYLWTPSTYITGDPTTLTPAIQPHEDIIYKLLVTAEGGCQASDTVFIEVLKAPTIPNTFTPNNDGVHDFWDIKYLSQYPNNRVQVFTRTGQLVFESHGYSKPWDGNKNGKPLPFDTYYYIIEPGNGRAPITGYVTIIK